MAPSSVARLLLLFSGLVASTAAQSARPPGTSQAAGPSPDPREMAAPFDVTHTIQGKVRDLARDGAGRILYCTFEREVGRIEPGRPGVTLLASAADSPFESQLRGLSATPSGNVAVVDAFGHVYSLPGGIGPAVKVYDDEYMVNDATDLIVDARGNYLVASATPSSGQRAVNWIQNTQRWSYYLVKHQPVALAHDPLTGGLVISESTAGGNLQLVAAGNPYRTTSPIDSSTHPGLSAFANDGDVAAEADGDLYWIAGGSIWKRTRATNTTSLFRAGFRQLRGVVIAASHGGQPSTTGWSLYVSEGEGPTYLREITGVGAPGPVIANDQGPVPNKGLPVNVPFGFQAYELTADNSGRLLLGGSLWGSTHFIKRVTLTPMPSIALLVNSASGLTGIIEGLCVAPDDSIYALTRTGTIHHITEGPLSITTVFSDPANQITAGKDLALDVDGTLYVAASEAWDFGKIMQVSGGGASLLTVTEETRGLAANPLGGMYFSQWHDMGFHGTVDLFHFGDSSVETLPGFSGINYTNGSGWGDGDICVDANGSVYTISEDDWSLIRYDPAQDGFERIGSSYGNRPSGLAIAPSTWTSGSTTGWSLYASEYDFLWEKPSVPPPASVLVDAALGASIGRSPVATPHPKFGRGRVLAPAPGGSGILIGTAAGFVLAADPENGEVVPLAGPDEGLRGAIVALSASASGRRVLAMNATGEVFELASGQARALATVPERVAPVLQHALEAPVRTLRLRDAFTGARESYVLDGWTVWRVDAE